MNVTEQDDHNLQLLWVNGKEASTRVANLGEKKADWRGGAGSPIRVTLQGFRSLGMSSDEELRESPLARIR